MPVKSVYLTNLLAIWLLLLLLPLGCGSDDEPEDDNQMVDSSPVLKSTIPSSGGILSSYGTLYMTFNKPPGIVIVNGELAIVAGKMAIWNASGLTSGQTVVLLITWTGNGGGIATVILTIL